MIERRAEQDGQISLAWYSPCETYRYGLTRIWRDSSPRVLFVMLNPSTATEMRNDPTIERCQRRAGALGFGGMAIANIFAYRATRPEDLRQSADPVGPCNDAVVRRMQAEASMIVAAWGVHGAFRGAGPAMAARLQGDVRHLGLTRAGHPRHPLYVPYSTSPIPWTAKERTP